MYLFINPALYENERRNLVTYILVFSVLFIFGALYSYYLLVPFTLRALYGFVQQTNVLPFFSLRDFFSLVSMAVFASGLFYTSPLTIFYLVKQNFIGIEDLENNRKQIIVALMIFAAILTPDPTPISMFLMSVPFYLIYEATIIVLKKVIFNEVLKDEKVIIGIQYARELLFQDFIDEG